MKIKGYSTNMYGWHEKYGMNGNTPYWEQIFRDCAQSGLDAVEMDPLPELVALARTHGLSVSGHYVGLSLQEPFESLRIEESVIPIAERLAKAGGTDILVNADPKGSWRTPQLKTEEDFKRQGDNLTRIAEAVKPLGLKLCMHNHAAIRHNAEGDLKSVVEYAGPDVGLCIDTGWAIVAGCDPIEWIRKYPDKVHAFHLRNHFGRIPSEDLIKGDIEMRRLLGLLDAIEYEGWLTLELWYPDETLVTRTMAENTLISIHFLKQQLSQYLNN